MIARYSAPFLPDGDMPIGTSTAKRLLDIALSRGGDYADLFFEYALQRQFVWEDGLVKAVGQSISSGMGARVLAGHATGYSYVQDLSFESATKAARIASSIANGPSSRVSSSMATPWTPERYKRLSNFDLPSAHQRRELLAKIEARAHQLHARVRAVQATFKEAITEVLVATSDGRLVEDRRPDVSLEVWLSIAQLNTNYWGMAVGRAHSEADLFMHRSPESYVDDAIRAALLRADVVAVPEGDCDVVLGPGNTAGLLQKAIGYGLEADHVTSLGGSYLGRLGEVVGAENITFVDDATIPGAGGTLNVDDEGCIPTQTLLIEDGVLTGHIHDRRSARHFGVSPTGNGRRESFQSHPMPRMTNTLLLAGQSHPDDVIRSVQRGVYVSRLEDKVEVDISTGNFISWISEGYLIERGILTAPIEFAMLRGNARTLLRGITMVAADLRMAEGTGTSSKREQLVGIGAGCPTFKVARGHVHLQRLA